MTHTVFRHPFTMVVSGSTGSGKTVWVMRLIANINSVIENGENSDDRAIDTLLYCYGALNSNVMELKRRESLTVGKEAIKIITHSSVPDEELIRKEAGPNRKLLLVLDDLMVTAKTHFSTHSSLSVLIIGEFPWYSLHNICLEKNYVSLAIMRTILFY